MSDLQNIEQPSWGDVVSTPAERNKVMRNTYWLLALSLLPTVLGACGRVFGLLDGEHKADGAAQENDQAEATAQRLRDASGHAQPGA